MKRSCKLFVIWLMLVPPCMLSAQKERIFECTDLIPESRTVFNIPDCDPQKPTVCVLYALPNGNTIEWTAGKRVREGDDWHYDIQHIAAQIRFLRNMDTSRNYIVVYLQAGMKAWTSYAAKYPESPQYFQALFDLTGQIVKDSCPYLQPDRLSFALNGHSGGGRFVFNLLQSFDRIPECIERIAFIDSNYGYETDLYGNKLARWIEGASNRVLCVLAYDDLSVSINGKPVVSPLGGTGYRSRMMYHDMNQFFPMQTRSDTVFVRYRTYDGRIGIAVKKNPNGNIYHTVLVERNGFIHSMFFATPLEERDYVFWGARAYTPYISESPIPILHSSTK